MAYTIARRLTPCYGLAMPEVNGMRFDVDRASFRLDGLRLPADFIDFEARRHRAVSVTGPVEFEFSVAVPVAGLADLFSALGHALPKRYIGNARDRRRQGRADRRALRCVL